MNCRGSAITSTRLLKICNTTGESRRAQAIEIYLDELRPVLKRLYELQ